MMKILKNVCNKGITKNMKKQGRNCFSVAKQGKRKRSKERSDIKFNNTSWVAARMTLMLFVNKYYNL